MKRIRWLLLASLSSFLLACGGDGGREAESAPEAGPATAAPEGSVTIVQPVDGDTLDGSTVHVAIQVEGIVIVPAGELEPGTGHHHLYLDRDVGAPGTVVPAGQEGIVHLGQGQTEFDFTDVAPGEHRLIAVVADGVHTILDPSVEDTVRFTVREN